MRDLNSTIYTDVLFNLLQDVAVPYLRPFGWQSLKTVIDYVPTGIQSHTHYSLSLSSAKLYYRL